MTPQKCIARKADVIAFFGNQSKTAEAFGVTPASVSTWPDPIPELRARQLLEMSDGQFSKYQLIDAGTRKSAKQKKAPASAIKWNKPKQHLISKADMIDFFGSQYAAARAFGIKSQSTVAMWPDPIPELRARQLLEIAGGRFTKYRVIDESEEAKEEADTSIN